MQKTTKLTAVKRRFKQIFVAGLLLAGANVNAQTTTNALNMDGYDDYVSLPAGLTSSMTSFTFEAWVNWSNFNYWQRIFDFGNDPTTNMFFTPFSDSYMPRFAITVGGGGGAEQRINSSVSIPLGTWTHVAVTLDGATGTGNMYINGALTGTTTGMTLTPASLGTLANNWLGRSQYPWDAYLGASEDDVRIWNVARTGTQIAANMNCEISAQTGLVAYYRLNEGVAGGTNTSIGTAIDQSGNGNHATLNNLALSGTSSNYVIGAASNCSGKVDVCHKGHTLSISSSALAAHLAHGDYVGSCSSRPGHVEENKVLTAGVISVYPNPSNGNFNVVIPAAHTTASIIVMDITGRIVNQRNVIDNTGAPELFSLRAGIYVVKVVAGNESHVTKMIVE
jgi:hypothetical protein